MDSTASSGSLKPIYAFYAGVIFLPLLVLAVLVPLVLPIPAWLMVPLILVAAGVAAFLTYRRYDKVDEILLDELDVVDADEVAQAREYNLLESLSLRSGVGAPELYLTDDQTVNALAIQQNKDAAAVITVGATEKLDRLQLEGLLAEVIARIANNDARTATVATGMMMPFTDGPFSFLAGPATAMINKALSGERELSGDQMAVNLTRYPPGLRDALTEADDQAPLGTPTTARLWVVPPAPYQPRYDLSVRLAALNEY